MISRLVRLSRALPAQAAAGTPDMAPPAGHDAATVAEVADAFRLLARLSTAEPAIALQLAQIQVPWGGSGRRGGGDEGSEEGSDGEGERGGPQPQADLVALVAAAAAALTRLPQPPIDALGAC